MKDLDARISELAQRAKMGTWNELVAEVKNVHPALAVGLMTGRAELIRAIPPSEVQTEGLLNLIATLVETNHALQDHARETAQLVNDWNGHFKGMLTSARKIQDFAHFRHGVLTDEDEDES